MADHFVIDGSNLATEGLTEPSLPQLREAVDAFRGEHPGSVVTVVVDASFEHRIDPSPDTFRRYEAALLEHVAALGRVAGRRGMASALTISDVGLIAFLRDELPRLGLGLVR